MRLAGLEISEFTQTGCTKQGQNPFCHSFITTKTNCSTFSVLLREQILMGHQNTSKQHPNILEGVIGKEQFGLEGAQLMLGTEMGAKTRARSISGGGRERGRVSIRMLKMRCHSPQFVTPRGAHLCPKI